MLAKLILIFVLIVLIIDILVIFAVLYFDLPERDRELDDEEQSNYLKEYYKKKRK